MHERGAPGARGRAGYVKTGASACDWGKNPLAHGVVKTMNVRVLFCNALRFFGAGLVMAAILAVPVFNLLIPLFGTAFMVRIARNIMRSARQAPRAASG